MAAGLDFRYVDRFETKALQRQLVSNFLWGALFPQKVNDLF